MTIVAAPAASATVTAIAAKSCAVSAIATAVALSALVASKSTQSILRSRITTEALLVRLWRRETRLSSLSNRVGSRARTTGLSNRRWARSGPSLLSERLQRILSTGLRCRLLLTIRLVLTGEHALVAAEHIRHATERTTAGSVLLRLRGLRRAGTVVSQAAAQSTVASMHRRSAKSTNVRRRGAVSIIGSLRRHTVAMVGLSVHALAEGSAVTLTTVGSAELVHVGVVVRAVVVGVAAVRETTVASLSMRLVHVLRLGCRVVLSSHGRGGSVVTAVLSITVTALSLQGHVRY